MLETHHIKNQFITNPDWKKVFLKHYPQWNVDDYVVINPSDPSDHSKIEINL